VQHISGDTRLLRYFLVAAEELHFGRAAERLHIAQPSLSRGIRSLEEALGVKLFVRVGRSVRLTRAGEVLQRSAPQALGELSRIFEECRAAGLGQKGHLSISFLPSARVLVLEAVERYRRRHGAIHLALDEALDEHQLAGLMAGRIDIAVVRDRRERPSLSFQRLIDAGLCVALPRSHPLATNRELSYADLASEDFVLWPRHESPDGFDRVIAGCRHAGFEPHVAAETSGAQMVAALVAAGVGVSVLGSGLGGIIQPGVAFVPLRDERDTLYVGWRARDKSTLRSGFVEALSAVAARHQTGDWQAIEAETAQRMTRASPARET
jgi:DNA-binding transcriptional LysR family regulator